MKRSILSILGAGCCAVLLSGCSEKTPEGAYECTSPKGETISLSVNKGIWDAEKNGENMADVLKKKMSSQFPLVMTAPYNYDSESAELKLSIDLQIQPEKLTDKEKRRLATLPKIMTYDKEHHIISMPSFIAFKYNKEKNTLESMTIAGRDTKGKDVLTCVHKD